MQKIGILAYGSLIEDPGCELNPLICSRIKGIKTPFSVEFARKSSSRGLAPTLVPVQKGGASVAAQILLLKNGITLEEAVDLLWRRETRNEGTGKHYEPTKNPNINQVRVEEISDFSGVDNVIYTVIGANIQNPTPTLLAELAIKSAMAKFAKVRKDGISYLISVKRQGIRTFQETTSCLALGIRLRCQVETKCRRFFDQIL